MQRDVRRRTLLDSPANEAHTRATPVMQQQPIARDYAPTPPDFCPVYSKPLCAVCAGDGGIKLILEDGGSSEGAHFCSKKCIGKYFFKYQVPKTY